MRLRVFLLVLLSALAVLFIWGAGQELEMTIPDPDRYRDSADYLYREGAFYLGAIGALLALGALYVLAGIVRGRRSWRLPHSAYLLIPVLLASALPYEGWIDSHGSYDSFGYFTNALFIAAAIALTWLTIRSLEAERKRHARTVVPTDDPLDLIIVTIFMLVAIVYEADEVWAGLLVLTAALLIWRVMRNYRWARHRRPQRLG
jgi:hypothetical protein